MVHSLEGLLDLHPSGLFVHPLPTPPLVEIASFLLLKKENDMGLPSFAFNTEWVSVHLYPEGIVYSFNRIITAYLGYTNQIATPFVVFDYSPYALFTTQNKISL